ncbi:MAG: Uma2 family endonuclease [Actinomycetota bacterium]
MDIEGVEPDVLFVRADHVDRVENRYVRGAPDLVVEISSPSTRRLELVRKRDLYARFGVPEYWYVDLEAELLEVYAL